MSDIRNINWDYAPHPKQAEFHAAKETYILGGGCRGGGKTSCLAADALMSCWDTPHNRVFIGRKVFLDFRMTTYVTLLKWIVWPTVKRHNEATKEIEFHNGSILCYSGFDDRKDVERMKGAEFGKVYVDQVEELTEDEFDMVCTTLRYKLPDGSRPHYQAKCTANPAQNWVKTRWIDNPSPDYRYIPATMKDNEANLPADYKARMINLYKNRPEMIKAFIEGDWNSQAQQNAIIKSDWIAIASSGTNIRPYNGGLKRFIVCDPARYGDDLTVVYIFRNYEVIGQEVWGGSFGGKKDTMATAGELVVIKERNKCNFIGIDVGGMGVGIADRLKEMGQPVYFINGSEEPDNKERFLNKRAEIYFKAADLMADSYVKIPQDSDLKTELNSVQYKVVDSRGKVKVEEKDDIKKRLGRSPDRADALVMGLWLCERAPFYRMDDRPQYSSQIKAEGQVNKMLAAVGKTGGW